MHIGVWMLLALVAFIAGSALGAGGVYALGTARSAPMVEAQVDDALALRGLQEPRTELVGLFGEIRRKGILTREHGAEGCIEPHVRGPWSDFEGQPQGLESIERCPLGREAPCREFSRFADLHVPAPVLTDELDLAFEQGHLRVG